MQIVPNTQMDQSVTGIGSIYSVNLVSELGKDNVSAAVSGLLSDETHIVDMNSEFEFPFQWKDHQKSKK